MKKFESSTSTSGSLCCENNFEERKISDDKMVSLLKLVFYERKSIKQSSNYLKINYNSAKRIIKNFRRNKIALDSGKNDIDQLVQGLKPKKKESTESLNTLTSIHQEDLSKNLNKPQINTQQIQEQLMLSYMTKQISQLTNTLLNLNSQIKQNQNTLGWLINITNSFTQN
jgi:molybdenum-dependent DNA-binding transcriptional regulator ModE